MAKTLDEILAENAQLTTDLATARTSLTAEQGKVTNLTTENTRLAGELATEKARVTTLTGDRKKLAADAKLPTDLVSASVQIATLEQQVQTLTTEKITVEKAVATKLASLGITDNPKAQAGGTGGQNNNTTAAWNPDAQILAARGVKSVDELNTKMDAQRAKLSALDVE